jgi:putative CocE/NonD family hydrolase
MNSRHRIRIGPAVLLAFLTLDACSRVDAARSAPSDDRARYTRREAMVPMRDGIRLFTEIYAPADPRGPLPVIFTRTPYGVGSEKKWNGSLSGYYKSLADEGYIFVFQDIRGRYRSEGRFVMMRPPRDRRDPKAVDESTDAYDTIEWVLSHVAGHNGRVGMLGISYPGWLTVMAMLDPHPALKAVSPQAPPADMYLGDDFHHNGAFRLSYGFEYAAMMETSKVSTNFAFDTPDTFDWYLRLGPLTNVNAKFLKGTIPTWNDYVAHPNYDAFWRRLAVTPYIDRVAVPTLTVAGWWDQEDFYGPLAIYGALEKQDTGGLNHFVAGPWNHGGWGGPSGRRLGALDFRSDTSRWFQTEILRPWFARHLKGEGDFVEPEAQTFQTGTDRWMAYDEWPPRKKTEARKLYFRSGRALSFEKPAEDEEQAVDSYVSNPADPVPYRARPIEATYEPRGSGWYNWQVEDQRRVSGRPDVLTWETPPLEADLVITGDIAAHLFASTTGTDSDWVVKLIDVYPAEDPADPKMAGYELMIVGEVLRGRFRKSFEMPQPLVPGRAEEFVVGLHQNDHCFLKGHRIMVQVQSTWFPLIDRNPQTYVENIFLAKASDYRTATQRIYRSASRPSYVELPVVVR